MNDMKKLICLIVSLCVMSVSYAQLKVYSSGKVGIARDTTTTARALLTIGNGTNDSQHNNAIYSDLPIVRGSYNISLDGKALSLLPDDTYTSYERSIGVRGIAGNSPDGTNYGVLGVLAGLRCGAGVYGSIDNLRGTVIDDYYAGYFDGNTKVDGNFTVTRNIRYTNLLTSGVSGNSRAVAFDNLSNEEHLGKMFNLHTVSYYNEPEQINNSNSGKKSSSTTQSLNKKHFAIPVEQLEENYPDLVYTLDDGSKAVNYIELIPILVQSINELNAKIAALEGSNAKTRSYNNTTDIDGLETINAALLSQNNPNPFTTATNIEMQIPSDASVVLFCIYDMSGKQVKQITINERGKTTLNVTSEGLSAGMYLYSLIIDGKVIDTRRMILTK